MKAKNSASRPAMPTLLRLLVALEAITFILATLLHLGVPLPLGFSEPAIRDAAIVEGMITLGMLLAAYALFSNATWARRATIVAHAIAVVGIALGIVALAAGKGPQSDANFIYHRVMIALAAAILILLLTPRGRAALPSSPQAT